MACAKSLGSHHAQVLIIGAGPTGLTLANLLGANGTHAIVVERNETTVQEPRAVSIDDESLRIVQSIGLQDVVLASIIPGYGSDYLMRTGRRFLRVEPTGRPYGFPRRNAFRQVTLEAQLREGVNRFENIKAFFGWSLEAFEQDAEGVTAHLVSTGGATQTVRCSYLVGCDGASSTVRRKLGIRLEGKSFAERWLIIDLEDSPVERRNTIVYCNARRPCIALPGPGSTRRFEFKLHAHESDDEMLRPEVVNDLLRSHGAHPASRLVRKVVYTFHARVTQRWSEGRVFVAGDAAHLTPPFAGQGMNSGLRDCSNLAWKLAFVTAGLLGPNLLASYERERHRHVWQMIKLALRMGRMMGPKSQLREYMIQYGFLLLGLWPAAKGFFAEMKYKPRPRFAAGFMQPDRLGKSRTLVGRMLLQPDVRKSNGERVPLDELLGCGFALLALELSPEDLRPLARHGTAAGRLTPMCVVINPTSISSSDSVVTATVASYPPEFEPYRGRVLLIRPDRYVAASGTCSGPASIEDAIAKLLRPYVNFSEDTLRSIIQDNAKLTESV
jgi:3-(3-hydroxy-phenyl)propionate hydroxylase